MRENTLKQQLYGGKAAFGVMCTFPSPPVVEMLGCLGFDWILLDNEHGSITVDTAEACIAAAELTGMAPIVRPVGNRPEIIAPFLDRGAWGVQVPHVNTADEARAAVDAAKYGPEGHRGIFSGGRPAHYGFKGATGDYAKEANRQTLVCLMLEEVAAIENLPELVTVPGVDVFFIGSGDLSQSMGYTGQQAHPEVQRMMEGGVKVIIDAGRIAGVAAPTISSPSSWASACSISTAAWGACSSTAATRTCNECAKPRTPRGSDAPQGRS
jgi:4-hydroxy-2-oxoheptanedioate aldolase